MAHQLLWPGAGGPLPTCVQGDKPALDAGGAPRDVQEAASYADPRTTMRCDRARHSIDRHVTYIVSAVVAGAAR